MTLAAIDSLDVFLLRLGNRSAHPKCQQLSVAGDGVERSPQLVGHRGQELTLRGIRFLRFLSRRSLALYELAVRRNIDRRSQHQASSIRQSPKRDAMEITALIGAVGDAHDVL